MEYKEVSEEMERLLQFACRWCERWIFEINDYDTANKAITELMDELDTKMVETGVINESGTDWSWRKGK